MPATGSNWPTFDKDYDMLKFLGGTIGIIFLIGLAVVIGLFALIL
ncbi:hypothetical protein [Microvirga splendida]|nr:hypothetical protein [Microvirga splendida]